MDQDAALCLGAGRLISSDTPPARAGWAPRSLCAFSLRVGFSAGPGSLCPRLPRRRGCRPGRLPLYKCWATSYTTRL